MGSTVITNVYFQTTEFDANSNVDVKSQSATTALDVDYLVICLEMQAIIRMNFA